MPTSTIAAIDLGSNSFHMIIAREVDGNLQIIDRFKEMVQLAAGLDEQNNLSRAARQRAMACLARFSQRLRDMPESRVRIVGTNTLRQARNGAVFLARAERVVGHPIEVISGVEEARLIYLGIAHTSAGVDGRRLVIDIGGGSTELIIGEGFKPLQLKSLNMGCVSMTRRYFWRKAFVTGDQSAHEAALSTAELVVKLEMEPVREVYQNLGWSAVMGASGTIRTIRDIVVDEGWCEEGITRDALGQLRTALLEAGSCTQAIADRWALSSERASVLTGGFMVLQGVVEALGIEHLDVADGALREGVVYDLLGRSRQEDVRERTIAMLSQRYTVDKAQAERVVATVHDLYQQVAKPWGLQDSRFADELTWAAQVHEMGLSIAHSRYHQHGAYIVRHSDLPGFSSGEQQRIAALVRSHRRKFPRKVFRQLPDDLQSPVERLSILLRLAVLLHRGHRRQELPEIRFKAKKSSLRLSFPAGWLHEHPLTEADLTTEAEHLRKVGWKLDFA